MDLNLMRSLVTVFAFVAFVLIVVSAWRSGNAAGHAEAAELPFAEPPAASPDLGSFRS